MYPPPHLYGPKFLAKKGVTDLWGTTPQFGQLDPFISARHNNILLVWYWYDMIRYDNDDNNDDCNDSYDDVDDNFGI